jgi:hypothetical protein
MTVCSNVRVANIRKMSLPPKNRNCCSAAKMSALGQKRTPAVHKGMSALAPIATLIAFFGCVLWAKSGHISSTSSIYFGKGRSLSDDKPATTFSGIEPWSESCWSAMVWL